MRLAELKARHSVLVVVAAEDVDHVHVVLGVGIGGLLINGSGGSLNSSNVDGVGGNSGASEVGEALGDEGVDVLTLEGLSEDADEVVVDLIDEVVVD